MESSLLTIRNQLLLSEHHLQDVCRIVSGWKKDKTLPPAGHWDPSIASEVTLTEEVVEWFIQRTRREFKERIDQNDCRVEDRHNSGCCARQIEQIQGSRYNAYMVRNYGSQQCLNHFC